MDELQHYRQCLAAPLDDDPGLRRAITADANLARAASRAANFQRQLDATLQQAGVPEGLEDRILWRLGMQQRRRRRLTGLLAVAASTLVAITAMLWPRPQPTQGFAQLALQHVYNEINHLEHLPGSTVASSTLRTLVREVGAELTGSLERVRFAYICPTPQGPGLHLITDGPSGPVTVLYVPQAHATTSRFADARFVGRASGTAGGGALAVIGETEQDVDSVQRRLRQQLRWSQATAHRIPDRVDPSA